MPYFSLETGSRAGSTLTSFTTVRKHDTFTFCRFQNSERVLNIKLVLISLEAHFNLVRFNIRRELFDYRLLCAKIFSPDILARYSLCEQSDRRHLHVLKWTADVKKCFFLF